MFRNLLALAALAARDVSAHSGHAVHLRGSASTIPRFLFQAALRRVLECDDTLL